MINMDALRNAINQTPKALAFGEVRAINEGIVISKGPVCKLGDLCVVGEEKIPCEVVRLDKEAVYLMPLLHMSQLQVGDQVHGVPHALSIPKVEKLLGRTIDGFGKFVDDGDPLPYERRKTLSTNRKTPSAMKRERIQHIMPTGVKAIDTLLTLGEGQRIGIFSGSGVGKSTLLGMIARRAKADINVIVLAGERGREVREFIEHDLGKEGVKRSVIVVSTSDEGALMTVKASMLGISIAEEFREQGKKVLFMMDSLTRFALARKQIDSASGLKETGGKTISMEPTMQKFLERAGTSDKGSITGIYTVLVEGDDMQGPIPDMARGILDGHIVLDRNLAALDQFPAIDVLVSASRVMDRVVTPEHWSLAREIKKYMGLYRANEDSFKLGAYVRGVDRDVDMAKLIYPQIMHVLKQGREESFEMEESLQLLGKVRE